MRILISSTNKINNMLTCFLVIKYVHIVFIIFCIILQFYIYYILYFVLDTRNLSLYCCISRCLRLMDGIFLLCKHNNVLTCIIINSKFYYLCNANCTLYRYIYFYKGKFFLGYFCFKYFCLPLIVATYFQPDGGR